MAENYKHVGWLELFDNGVEYECIVLKKFNNGDLAYIRLDILDPIDLKRLQKILSRRDATRYPLWDLLSQATLNNGLNALEYFHQLVITKTVTGEHLQPTQGRRGTSGVRLAQKNASNATASETAPPKRGPGRPPSTQS